MATFVWGDTLLEKIKTAWKIYPEIFIFTFVSLGVVGFYNFMQRKNQEDVRIVKLHYADGDADIQNELKRTDAIDSISLFKNLKTIYFYINDIKQSKLYLATKYEWFFIACYTIGIFFIVLTAVIAFVVTKKGWDNSNRKRKALLLTCAFYGILLPTFPKLFDQEKNYKNNFSDYTALSNSQLYIYHRLNPYFGKMDTKLDHDDSTVLKNTMDTVTNVVMQHLNIDISIDQKQLEVKTVKFD